MTQHLAIETQGLIRRFGRLRAVDEVSLKVPQGVVFGFLGPNGAGKTTTIRMILGLLHTHGGAVRILGADLKKNRKAALSQAGVSFEAPAHYEHLSVGENLTITRRLRGLPGTEVDRVLDIVELRYAKKVLARNCSLGMRHRLGLAKALLGTPRLLVFDEPTNGLDPIGISEMRTLIKALPGRTGATVFVSSHHLSEVEQMASHLAVIHKGRLVYQGRLDALRGLSAPVLEIRTLEPEAAAKALAENGYSAVLQDGVLRVDLTAPATADNEAAAINRLLNEADIAVPEVKVARRTLEDLFLQLVDAGPGAEVAA